MRGQELGITGILLFHILTCVSSKWVFFRSRSSFLICIRTRVSNSVIEARTRCRDEWIGNRLFSGSWFDM